MSAAAPAAVAPPAADALARAHPEWRAWLALLALARHESEREAWAKAVPAGGAAPSEPWLAGARVVVDERALTRWARALFETAAEASDTAATLRRLGGASPAALIVIAEAALDADAARLAAEAARSGVDADALAAAAPLLVTPLLRACARSRASADLARWTEGSCPLCAAWPVLAEARGLEGTRQLRCGRCGGDWRFDWLRCPFCGNDDHERLGGLVGEATGETRKVETCAACHGYVKTVMTLRPTPPDEVPLLDLDTVDLDVAALERGYRRPSAPARPLGVRLESRPSGWRPPWRR